MLASQRLYQKGGRPPTPTRGERSDSPAGETRKKVLKEEYDKNVTAVCVCVFIAQCGDVA